MVKTKAKRKKTTTTDLVPSQDVDGEKLPVVLITNCTASQSVPPNPDLMGSSLPSGLTHEEAAALWCGRVTGFEPTIPPAQLYRGVAFYSISRARTLVDPKGIHIISIGQGLVGLTQPIVPYDLSIDPKHRNSLTRVVTSEKFKPPFWWQLVNAGLRGVSSPIAEVAASTGAKLVIVACTNRFQALVAEDLLELAQIDEAVYKLRVVCGSTTSLPNQLRPFAIVYDKRMNRKSIGNRNDFNQRAALNFLRLLQKTPKLLDGPLEVHKQLVAAELDKIAPIVGVGNDGAQAVEAVRALLEGSDDLRGMSPDAAHVAVQHQYSITITTSQFRRVWRQVLGLTAGERAPATKSASTSAARKALEAIAGQLNRTTGSSSWEDEEEALRALREFVVLVREAQPGATFGSAEVYAWAHQYYLELGKVLPVPLMSVGKVAWLLKGYKDDLGLDLVGSGASQGGNVFRVR